MRLSDQGINTIKSSLQQLDPEASVYLFGSRTDDTALGGDIDLLIDSKRFDNKTKAAYRWALIAALGKQKFDLIVNSPKNRHFVACIEHELVKL